MNEIRNFVIQKVFGWYSQFLDLCKTKFKNNTRVKLISVTYWIKLWLSTQAQWSWHIWMYYSLMCVRIAKCWFPTFIERAMRCNMYVTYQFGDTIRSTPFQLRIQWFSKWSSLCHMACVQFTLVVLVCSHRACSWETECHEDAYVESSAFVEWKFQRLVENLRYCWWSCW